MTELHLDWETASEVDLTKVGLDVYSAHPSTRILMGAYRIDDGRLNHWQPHERPMPGELKEGLEDPEVYKWGFNVLFERMIAKRVAKLRITRRRWRCSQTLAYMMSFMGDLKEIGQQISLGIDEQKMKDGKRLIRKFSLPQKITRNQPNEWRNWITDPDDWAIFGEYNCQDVVAEEGILKRLRHYYIPDWRWEDYEMAEEINDRGAPINMDFVQNVIWMSARRKAELLSRMQRITGVENPNSVSQLLPWLQEHGYPRSDLQKHTVSKIIKDKVGDKAMQRVLRLRQWASRTSVSKAEKAVQCVGADSRIRFLFQFAGAGRTNRFAGRQVQSQNMMVTPKILDAEEDDTLLASVTNSIVQGRYDGLDLMLGEPMIGLTGCMRSMFYVPEGDDMIAVDLKSIESAVIAWVTGCERLLQVFYDGRDPYKDFGTEFYRKAYDDITRAERGICKPPALGCGFRLSGGQIFDDGTKSGLLAYAENMNVDMTEEEANRAVKIYRNMYPEIPQFWKDNETAIRQVLRSHQPYELGYLKFHYRKPFLLIRLPSGRDIFYYKPQIEKRRVTTKRMIKVKVKFHPDRDDLIENWGYSPEDVIEEPETYIRHTFTYMGKDQKTTQWRRLDGHGGVTTENIVQAIAYDVLMEKMRMLKALGYPMIMHAHDEITAQIRRGSNRFTLAEMIEVFKAPIAWAPGLPLGGSGWQGPFYRKA